MHKGDIRRSSGVKKRLKRRIAAWNLGQHDMLTEDTERTMKAQLSKLQSNQTEVDRAETFNHALQHVDISLRDSPLPQ